MHFDIDLFKNFYSLQITQTQNRHNIPKLKYKTCKNNQTHTYKVALK